LESIFWSLSTVSVRKKLLPPAPKPILSGMPAKKQGSEEPRELGKIKTRSNFLILSIDEVFKTAKAFLHPFAL
jgi:hypothetical protein